MKIFRKLKSDVIAVYCTVLYLFQMGLVDAQVSFGGGAFGNFLASLGLNPALLVGGAAGGFLGWAYVDRLFDLDEGDSPLNHKWTRIIFGIIVGNYFPFMISHFAPVDLSELGAASMAVLTAACVLALPELIRARFKK